MYSMIQSGARMLTSGGHPQAMGPPGPQYPGQSEGPPGAQPGMYGMFCTNTLFTRTVKLLL